MIYIFTGDDTFKKRKAYQDFLSFFLKKEETEEKEPKTESLKNKDFKTRNPENSKSSNTEKFFFSDRNFNKDQIKMLISGGGLFSKKTVVIIENSLEKEETKDFILKNLQDMADSPNDFVFIEDKQQKAVLDEFIEKGAEVNRFEVDHKAEERKHFNVFALADAFSTRNKLLLWMLFRQALEKEIPLEELAGVLFWKAKDMLLKKSYGKYSEKELQDFASTISYLLPKARKEGKDAETAFEQFLLDSV